jgi:MFS family permease
LLSILLTLFSFKETLPESKRGVVRRGNVLVNAYRMLLSPRVGLLLVLMFAQQVIFYGFESLLGLFTLNRLGLLGQGNAVIFVIVGVLLVMVQVRGIGQWTRRFGEARVAQFALGLLAVGLLLLAITPQQPHPFYVRQIVQGEIAELSAEDGPNGTEAIIGDIAVDLPYDYNRGIGGLLLTLVAIVPLSIGAGLIRPSLNSLMTKRVASDDFGSVLGASAAFVSAANAIAPLIGGLLFQRAGPVAPFAIGGVIMLALCIISVVAIRKPAST